MNNILVNPNSYEWLKFANPYLGYKLVRDLIALDQLADPVEVLEANLSDPKARRAQNFWSAIPYLVEPLRSLMNRRYRMMVFIGPAQCGKTFAFVHGGIVYSVTENPYPMGVLHSSETLAKSLSRDVARVFAKAPIIQQWLSPNKKDNTDKVIQLANGAQVNFLWPSSGILASRSFQMVLSTDVDRMPADASGEGSAQMQLFQRTRSYRSAGKMLMESSPGSELVDPDDRPSDPHEPPIATCGVRENIVEFYAQGTRKLWYVPCPESACGEYYPMIPGVEGINYSENASSAKEAGEKGGSACPHCGSIHGEIVKHWQNQRGRWVAQGQSINKNGDIIGHAPVTDIDSYWLGPMAAQFLNRHQGVAEYVNAENQYKRTGDQLVMRNIVNGTLSGVHTPQMSRRRRLSARLLQTRTAKSDRRIIPANCRYLIKSVDVQGYSFVIKAVAYDPQYRRYVVDYKEVSEYNGKPVDPAADFESWAVIRDEMRVGYPIEGHEDWMMPPVLTVVDYGGKDGVSQRARAFYMLMEREGLDHKIALVKGDAHNSENLIRVSTSNPQTDPQNVVPLLMLNSNALKDIVYSDLEIKDDQKDRHILLPKWADEAYFKALLSERRDEKGKWKRHGPNEPFDLLCYAEAATYVIDPPVQSIDWDNPPFWAMPIETNDFIVRG